MSRHLSSTSRAASSRAATHHVAGRLQAEWDQLNNRPSSVRRARAWGWRFHHVRSLDDALLVTGFRPTPGSAVHVDLPTSDEVLAQLLVAARTDQLAGRVVLQRLMPGIASVARRHRSTGADGGAWSDRLDDTIGIAWTVIRTFPVERRSRFVAASLLHDIEYHMFIRPYRRRATFIPQPTDDFDRTAAQEPTAAAADELRELLEMAAHAGVDAAEIDLARRLGRGESTSSLAAACNVTDRTIRNRRTAVTARLREVAAACA